MQEANYNERISATTVSKEPIVSPMYSVIENAHIFLWLLKDMCWAWHRKIEGAVMAALTVIVAVYLLWRSRHVRSEFYHNLAICIWISANSAWMVEELILEEPSEPEHIYHRWIFILASSVMTVYYVLVLSKARKTQSGNKTTARESNLNV